MAKQTSKKKPDNNKSLVLKALITLSVLLNILLIVGFLAITSFVRSDRSTTSMLNYFISTKLDDKGCVPADAADLDAAVVAKYGKDVSVCVRTTIESPDGIIQWPESLKGQTYTQ